MRIFIHTISRITGTQMKRILITLGLLALVINSAFAIPTIVETSSAGTTIKFTAKLSERLPIGYKVKIDYSSGKGFVPMTCNVLTCTLSTNVLPQGFPYAPYRVGVYNSSGILQGQLSQGTYGIFGIVTNIQAPVNPTPIRTLPSELNFGTITSGNPEYPNGGVGGVVNFHLINPITLNNGKTYYYVDFSGNGIVDLNDKLNITDLSSFLNQGGAVTDQFDSRSVSINGYTVILPNYDDLLSLNQQIALGAITEQWINNKDFAFWSSTDLGGRHRLLYVKTGINNDQYGYDNWQYTVMLEVVSNSVVQTPVEPTIRKLSEISLTNIVTSEGVSLAGNANGKVTVSYTLNGNGADLGYSVIDLKDLSVVASSSISNPYGQIIGRDQGIRSSIDAGNQTMVIYNSQPLGYHANQNAIFVNSDGTHSSEYVLTNGNGAVADWLGVISRFTDGKYALVMQSERQGAMDIFAEMLDGTGTNRTVELFRVNNTLDGEQVAPNCYAVPNSHKLLVSWYNVQSGSGSQIALIDMDKQLNVSGDQVISNAAPNTVINQSVLVDTTGTHGQALYIEGGDIWSRSFDISGNSLTMGETTNLTSSLHWGNGVNFVRASSVLGNDGQQYIALVGNNSTTQKVFLLKTQMSGKAKMTTSLEVYSGLKNDGLTPRVDISLADGQLVMSWLTTNGIGIASIN